MHLLALSFLVCLLAFLAPTHASLKHAVKVHDQKEWKKLLKTRTNVLALFANGEDGISDFIPKYDKVASIVKGKGTMVYVDCQPKDGKKLCKHLKVNPNPFVMKHYKDGSFHKDYDRLMEEKSLLSFMENPAADPPWSEDPMANDVRHVEGPSDFERLLKKEKKPILMMFYAPWCGHCKQLKPEFASAATELKKRAVLAGMDVDTPDAYGIRHEFNISGFPTLIYFEKGRKKYEYAGGRDKEGIMEWISNPQPPENLKQSPSEDDQPWSDVESDVVHLTEETFTSFVAANPSVLVMFYAPWCGHCKAMKPDYTEAASLMKERDITGVLAAVDATKAEKLAEQYKVEGFPTIKYFKDGAVMYDYGYGRTAEDLVEFMSDPKAPPPPEKEWSEIESEVIHLTDETFKSTLKKKKHSLVMFYAPWCGHCKAAKPGFTSAAEQFQADKKTMFAALDCTKFHSICEQQGVQGFPTFKYFSYGKKEYPYYGERNEESFSEFMSDPVAYLRDEL